MSGLWNIVGFAGRRNEIVDPLVRIGERARTRIATSTQWIQQNTSHYLKTLSNFAQTTLCHLQGMKRYFSNAAIRSDDVNLLSKEELFWLSNRQLQEAVPHMGPQQIGKALLATSNRVKIQTAVDELVDRGGRLRVRFWPQVSLGICQLEEAFGKLRADQIGDVMPRLPADIIEMLVLMFKSEEIRHNAVQALNEQQDPEWQSKLQAIFHGLEVGCQAMPLRERVAWLNRFVSLMSEEQLAAGLSTMEEGRLERLIFKAGNVEADTSIREQLQLFSGRLEGVAEEERRMQVGVKKLRDDVIAFDASKASGEDYCALAETLRCACQEVPAGQVRARQINEELDKLQVDIRKCRELQEPQEAILARLRTVPSLQGTLRNIQAHHPIIDVDAYTAAINGMKEQGTGISQSFGAASRALLVEQPKDQQEGGFGIAALLSHKVQLAEKAKGQARAGEWAGAVPVGFTDEDDRETERQVAIYNAVKALIPDPDSKLTVDDYMGEYQIEWSQIDAAGLKTPEDFERAHIRTFENLRDHVRR